MTTGTEKPWSEWVILVLLHILLFSKLNKWYNNKWNSAMLFLFEPHFTNHEVYYTLVLCYDGINNNCDEKSWNMDALTSCRQLFGVDYFCGILLSRTQLNTSAHHWKGPPVKHTQKNIYYDLVYCYPWITPNTKVKQVDIWTSVDIIFLCFSNCIIHHCLMGKVSSAHLQLPAEWQREWRRSSANLMTVVKDLLRTFSAQLAFFKTQRRIDLMSPDSLRLCCQDLSAW